MTSNVTTKQPHILVYFWYSLMTCNGRWLEVFFLMDRGVFLSQFGASSMHFETVAMHGCIYYACWGTFGALCCMLVYFLCILMRYSKVGSSKKCRFCLQTSHFLDSGATQAMWFECWQLKWFGGGCIVFCSILEWFGVFYCILEYFGICFGCFWCVLGALWSILEHAVVFWWAYQLRTAFCVYFCVI